MDYDTHNMSEPLTDDELYELGLAIETRTLQGRDLQVIANKLYESTKTVKAELKKLKEKYERFVRAVGSHNLTSTLMEG